MARPGLSYQDVVSAIETIEAQGEKTTISSIRKIIGSGSPTTISKFLKQWRESQQSEKPKMDKPNPNAQSETIMAPKAQQNLTSTKNKPFNEINDPVVKALMTSAEHLSHELLTSLSDEWNLILDERDTEIKARKLYAALVKEQTRRETAEKIAKEAKAYGDAIKEQTTQRIVDLRDSLESQIAFLNGQIRQLKRESDTNLEHYRAQLERANLAIAALKKTK